MSPREKVHKGLTKAGKVAGKAAARITRPSKKDTRPAGASIQSTARAIRTRGQDYKKLVDEVDR